MRAKSLLYFVVKEAENEVFSSYAEKKRLRMSEKIIKRDIAR